MIQFTVVTYNCTKKSKGFITEFASWTLEKHIGFPFDAKKQLKNILDVLFAPSSGN